MAATTPVQPRHSRSPSRRSTTHPVLDNSGDMALNSILEDNLANSGTLISDVIASAGGDRITDPDAGAVEGIAVIAADTANGSWQFSTDNGGSWNSLGGVSATNARLLASDAVTRIRFESNPTYNGVIDPAITFQAWDQTNGSNGGTANSSVGGGATAFSTTTETASLIILPVNNAPILDNSGDMALAGILEDATANVGTPIADLIASAGGDRITDVDDGAVEGIAIIDADISGGSWQFSTDDGGSWIDLGGVSAVNARLLAADAATRIRLVPNVEFQWIDRSGDYLPGMGSVERRQWQHGRCDCFGWEYRV